jgi:hypothetical protein
LCCWPPVHHDALNGVAAHKTTVYWGRQAHISQRRRRLVEV